MGTPEFPDLGKHCSLETCQLIDFLPFKCDKCDQIYCLDHRSYSSHHCKFALDGDSTVIVCPLCARTVKLVPNENPNSTWERHARTNCDPSNYEKIKKKKRCPVPGCKESLTFSNKVLCKDCHQEVCLKHRFGPDHSCDDAIKRAREEASLFNQPFFQGFKNKALELASASGLGSFTEATSNKSKKQTSSSSDVQRKPVPKPAPKNPNLDSTSLKSRFNSFTGSISNTLSTFTSKNSQPNSNPKSSKPKGQTLKTGVESASAASKSSQVDSNVEVCPQCQANFHDVSELILHVDKIHLSGNDSVKSAKVGFHLGRLKS